GEGMFEALDLAQVLGLLHAHGGKLQARALFNAELQCSSTGIVVSALRRTGLQQQEQACEREFHGFHGLLRIVLVCLSLSCVVALRTSPQSASSRSMM